MNETIEDIRTKSLALENIRAGYWPWLAGLLSLSLVLPIIPAQFVSGPLVNAMLIIATVVLGRKSAIMIAIIPSPIALLTGVLPFVLAPMVPLIIISNIILIFGFDLLYRKNFWSGLGLGAGVKFLWLFAASQVLNQYVLSNSLPGKVLVMMSYPQLLTALLGGVIAFAFLKTIKKI